MADEIWLVDDDRGVRFVLAEALRDAGLGVREFGDAESLRAALRDEHPALVVTDVRMPGEDGLALLVDLQQRAIGPVIVMSAYTDVATTAAAYRAGAVDYLAKPFDLDQAVAAVQRALDSVATPTPASSQPIAPNHALLGESAPMREVFRLIGRVAASDLNVLVTGETGTGKELVARALHEESARRDKPFVALNTAAIPSELLESELFGHEAGAFTGATRRVAGRFEQADGGTLFLDEVAELPLAPQAALLRALEDLKIRPVGSQQLLPVNVRIVAATNRSLAGEVAAGRFRKDLYYRLQVVELTLPPLREHKEDIPGLVAHFMAQLAPSLGVEPLAISDGEMAYLMQYDWPGNVRELRNLIERSLILGTLNVSALYVQPARAAEQASEGTTDLHTLEKQHILSVLDSVQGDKTRAAQLLGISRRTLERRVAEWALA